MPIHSSSPAAHRKLLHQPAIRQQQRYLQVISGQLRFPILVLLAHVPSGLTGTEIARALNGSLSRISHQLRILREAKVIKADRHGRQTTFRLVDRRAQRLIAG